MNQRTQTMRSRFFPCLQAPLFNSAFHWNTMSLSPSSLARSPTKALNDKKKKKVPSKGKREPKMWPFHWWQMLLIWLWITLPSMNSNPIFFSFHSAIKIKFISYLVNWELERTQKKGEKKGRKKFLPKEDESSKMSYSHWWLISMLISSDLNLGPHHLKVKP